MRQVLHDILILSIVLMHRWRTIAVFIVLGLAAWGLTVLIVWGGRIMIGLISDTL